MKKLTLCLLLFSGILFANEIVISKSFKEMGTIKPQSLFATIEITGSSQLRNIGELENSDRKSITNTLNSIIQDAKKDNICNGGSYSINPIFNYKDESRNVIGQDLRFNLECKFDENSLSKYNAILKTINEKVSQNPLLMLPQPKITSRITQEEINSKKESLFTDFLSSINNIEASYSKTLNKTCSVTKIDSNDDFAPVPLARVMMSDAAVNASDDMDSTYTNAPIGADTEVSINVVLQINCKDN